MKISFFRSPQLNQAATALSGAIIFGLIALLVAYQGIGMAWLYIAIPLFVGYLFMIFRVPKTGLMVYGILSYFAIGINRYVEGSLGLSIDFALVMSWIVILLNFRNTNFKPANSSITYIMLIWFAYTFLLLFNPEARSNEAWFYAIRGLSVYFVLAVPLVLILFNTRRDLSTFLKFYLALTIIAALWGFKQYLFGPDAAEKAWLDEGAYKTHILFGRLRVFSFLSDAGQFGALMAHAIIVTTIMALSEKRLNLKGLYFFLAAFFAVSLAISGSRGPVIIVFAGLGIYLLVVRNFRLLVIGLFLGAGIFSFLKYTSIGSGVYEIQRLRTALNPNDASFQVRLENQKLLKAYLASRPFGGGVGSGGSWGQRFTPGTVLADIPYDSWYVKVWVETGIIGLTLYIILILVTLIIGFRKLMQVKDNALRMKLSALYAGYFGLCVGSYGNQIYGQIPISTVIVFSLAFIFLAPKLDKQADETKPESLHNHR